MAGPVRRSGSRKRSRPSDRRHSDVVILNKISSMKPYLDPVGGDRRQEIVFIGADPMDEAMIRAELDACLIHSPGLCALNSGETCPTPSQAGIARRREQCVSPFPYMRRRHPELEQMEPTKDDEWK